MYALLLTFTAYWLRDAPTGLTLNNCTLCPHSIYVFCIYLRQNSDLCHLQHKLICFITEMKVFTVRYGLDLQIQQPALRL